MIKFFRKIRYQLLGEGKTGKYLKYAVGEIVLVVIGILIALSINNWNEDRKAIIKEKSYIRSIYHDIKDDIKNIETNRKILSEHYYLGLDVLKALELKDSKPIDSVRIATSLGWQLSQVIPVDRDENTWDKFKVLGADTFIINDSITTLLNSFYAKYDKQIERFNQLPKKLRQDLRELTGYCHNSIGLEVMNKKGIEYYGFSSPQTRQCIISIENAQELVGAIMVTSIVNTKIYEELKYNANIILSFMKGHYEFLNN
ncbi:MAG: hypothetical protein KAJ28_09165 [Flavobacteriaceae bacterium]|nr:hypothetical protein [Flavobacteriaceae bacterium]